MQELITKELNIKDMIYEIRGVQVMLDSDLAKLYQVETRVFNQAVKRNINRFPEEFMFRINITEYQRIKGMRSMSSQNVMTSKRPLSSMPYVFTEQGVSMLSSILRSDIAIKTSISIINAFVAMRKYFNTTMIEQKHINNLVLEHDYKLNKLEESFSKFEEKSKTTDIYYNGQIYDAYSAVLKIFNTARKNIIIIDSYADNTILDIIKRLEVKVTLITKEKNLLTKQDIEKYNKQYSNLKVIYNNTFHDRFFIIDNNDIYHCGASINIIGYKTFCINLICDEKINSLFLNIINKII